MIVTSPRPAPHPLPTWPSCSVVSLDQSSPLDGNQMCAFHSCIENLEFFALLIKICQSDRSFTWVDEIEVAHKMKRNKLQYDICKTLILGRLQ
jgi:hypothetical protein